MGMVVQPLLAELFPMAENDAPKPDPPSDGGDSQKNNPPPPPEVPIDYKALSESVTKPVTDTLASTYNSLSNVSSEMAKQLGLDKLGSQLGLTGSGQGPNLWGKTTGAAIEGLKLAGMGATTGGAMGMQPENLIAMYQPGLQGIVPAKDAGTPPGGKGVKAPAMGDAQFGQGGQPPKDGGDNKEKPKDAGEKGDRVKLDPKTQEEKDKFLKSMEGRLSEADMKALKDRLDTMDQRILKSGNVKESDGKGGLKERGAEGAQKELAETYKELTRLSGADKKVGTDQGQIYGDMGKKGTEIVNKGVMDTVNRLADPRRAFNQGQNPTCALQSIGRQQAELSPSNYAKQMADIANKGEFTAQKDGKDMTVTVDKASLRRPDEAAMSKNPWSNNDQRGVAGMWGDFGNAQLNLDLKGEGKVYRNDPKQANHRNPSGEGVYTKGAKEGTFNFQHRSPETDARGIVNTKDALFRDRFGKGFAKETTLVDPKAFGRGTGAKEVDSPAALQKALKDNQDKGWTLSTIGMHTQHWANSEGQGGAGGWHAISAELNKDGSINLWNNWGGKFNEKSVNADRVHGLMDQPGGTPQGQGQDHVFDPDGKSRVPHPDDKKDEKKPEEKKEEKKEDKDKEKDKDKKPGANADAQARVSAALARLAAATNARERAQAQTELSTAESALSQESNLFT